jgi:hypothetical protein
MVNSPTADPLGDPYIVLRDEDYNWVGDNNDCSPLPPPYDSCLTRLLSEGTYIIEATAGWAAPWYPGDTGDFLISLDGGAVAPTEISVGIINSTFTIDGTQDSLVMPGPPTNYATFFEFTVDEVTIINVDMQGTGVGGEIVDPYIALYGPDPWPWFQTDTCDRPLGPNDACFTQILQPGTYTLEATTGLALPNPGETGDFRLSVYESPRTPVTVGDPSFPDTLTNTGDSAWWWGKNADYYEFELTAGQTVYIDMVNSPSVDPIDNPAFIIRDAYTGWWMDSNWNCGLLDTPSRPLPSPQDACTTTWLDKGRYIIEVIDEGAKGTGEYWLNVY